MHRDPITGESRDPITDAVLIFTLSKKRIYINHIN